MRPRRNILVHPLTPVSVFVLVISAAVTFFFRPDTTPSGGNRSSVEQSRYASVHVAHAYDGDTVRLSTGEKVRLIGIDTPEMHESDKMFRDAGRSGQDINTIKALGQRACNFVRPLVEGKNVRLEFDAEPRDKYGRLLAYLYLSDGTFLNEEIIKNGYAYPLTIPPNIRFADRFESLFQQAVTDKKGLWADSKPAVYKKKKRRKSSME